jgi:Mitochondrial carrier protein
MEATTDDFDRPTHDRGSPAVRAAKDITFGSVCQINFIQSHSQPNLVLQAAGIVSKVFEHPFDLTKVRLQAQVLDATARFRGPLDCLVQTFKNEGARGLYRVCILFFPSPREVLIGGVSSIGSTCTNSWRNGRERYIVPCIWRAAKPHSTS